MSEGREKSNANLVRSGRKKGSKNKSTLVREALRGEWDDLLVTQGKKVFEAVVEKAIDGDMTAAKLILDRVVPVAENKTAGKLQLGEGGLVIHIDRLEATPSPTLIEAGKVEEAVYTEVSDGDQE